MKVGIWYEVSYKSIDEIKLIVMRTSEEIVKNSYYDRDGYYICYKVKVYEANKDSCDIVEENWNFRELSSLELELL